MDNDNSSTNWDNFFTPADEKHIKKEKAKAYDMRKSQWWKNQRGKGVCHYCKVRVPAKELTMDHIVPIVRGGKTTKGNVVPCCKECNNKKKYMLPIEWEEYLQSISDE
ncbi:MAG: HNH endonuclease [Deltaproteobacteria bacterium]|nr:HNH endonuclease [Deltaproteobacteria bacterium]